MLTVALLVGFVQVAAAQSVDDEAWTEDPRRAEPETYGPPPAKLWLSFVGSLGLDGVDERAAGMILLGGKFDSTLKMPEVRSSAAESAKVVEPTEDPSPTTPLDDEEGPTMPRAAPVVPSRGKLARGAVRAAIAAAGSKAVDVRYDDAATRARASGIIPEVRLRVAHVVDEDQALSPTEYDPERVTASGGTSLWFEGRATFRLDRLVFADDEIAIERLRADRAKLEQNLAEDVLRTFEIWQRAEAALASELTEPEQRDKAEIDAAVAEARLDAWTDGWFSRASSKLASSDEVVGEPNGARR